MAGGVAVPIDRRGGLRVAPELTRWQPWALLRPGQDVVIINLSCGGALVESGARMSPGARTELQLMGETRRIVRGHIGRCRVTALDPIRYEAAIVFEQELDWHTSERPLVAPADAAHPAAIDSPVDLAAVPVCTV